MTPRGPYQIVHLDVDRPRSLPEAPETEGTFAVCWLDGVPLGQFYVHAGRLPLSEAVAWQMMRSAIAPALRGYLAATTYLHAAQTPSLLPTVRRRVALPAEDPPLTMSVVIPTRDRPEDLARCLDTLAEQTTQPVEILVVDNAPATDATEKMVGTRPGIRYVREPRAGASAARNAGIRESTGEVIAFTDDDMVLHPAWLARLGHAFADPETAAVTGLTLPAELETGAQILFEWEWGFGRGFAPQTFDRTFFEQTSARGVPVWDIGGSGNMAVRRTTLDAAGGFDERLGAGTAGCSEDSELYYRFLSTGHVVRYVPAAVGYHRHRRTMPELRRQLRAYMRGHVSALLVQHERTGHRGNVRRLALDLPRYYARRVARGLVSGFHGRNATLGPEMRGVLSGVLYYHRNRQPPPRHE